jgi:hypothetical protein
MRPHQPWALATSGSGSPGGVSIRGIFGTEDGCLMFRKSYLGRRKVASEIASENKETKAELYEEAGILLTSDGRWYTARCLLLSTLPSPSSDLSGIEDALREIAHSVIR